MKEKKERKLMLVINNLTEKEKIEIINISPTGELGVRKDKLSIENLTKEQIKQLMVKVREIEQRNPDRTIFCQVVGLEDKNIVDAKEFMEDVFPTTKKAS